MDTKTAFLFPGQGSQSVGMASAMADASPVVRQTFDEASDALGYDLWDVTENGPAEKLGRTEITQPALLAAGIATWRAWKALGGAAPALANLIRHRFGYKYHYAVVDYLQRSARHIASRTDVEQAYAMGQAAVEFAAEGRNAVMPTVERISDSPYRWRVGVAPLKDVANKEKKLPRSFISRDGFHITEACRRYLEPLIQGEDYPPFHDGLPYYVTLKNRKVPRLLKTPFELNV